MINFHPSDESLARLAAGSLEAGPSVVVRTHLGLCRQCAKAVARFEAVGGTLLDEIEPAELGSHAFAQTLALLESQQEAKRPARSVKPAPPNGPIELPPALQELDIGRWRWLAPGVRRSRVTIPYAPEADLVLYRIGPGRRLPHHGHAGAEYTQVLSGSFADHAGSYVPGDLIELDGSVDHQPQVGPEGECICLAAVEGRMLPHGAIGWLLRPFV
jgi:putative transcriptional regulator